MITSGGNMLSNLNSCLEERSRDWFEFDYQESILYKLFFSTQALRTSVSLNSFLEVYYLLNSLVETGWTFFQGFRD